LGHRVVILDLELFSSAIHTIPLHQKLHLSNDKGMSEVLAHKHTIASVIQHSAHENLDVVPSGKLPPNPSKLLSGERMGDVIAKLRTVYDIILLDMPSMQTRECHPLVASCDVSLFVVRAKKTPKESLEMIDRFYLEHSETINCALVLNDLVYPKPKTLPKKDELDSLEKREDEDEAI